MKNVQSAMQNTISLQQSTISEKIEIIKKMQEHMTSSVPAFSIYGVALSPEGNYSIISVTGHSDNMPLSIHAMKLKEQTYGFQFWLYSAGYENKIAALPKDFVKKLAVWVN